MLSWSCRHPFCRHLDIQAGIRKGGPGLSFPHQAQRVPRMRESERRTSPPQPTPRGCGTGKWQAALQAAENHHYPRGAVLGGKAWVCPFVFCSLGIIPRREIVGHMVDLCLISEQLFNCFRKWLYHFTFPSAMYDF